MSESMKSGLTRRSLFGVMGSVGVGAAMLGASSPARADAIADLVAKEMGTGPAGTGSIALGAPDKAENGGLVRIPISVDHPMEPGNYIESLGVFVDNNPKPLVAKFRFTPETGTVNFELRIKMAKPSPVRVVAKSNTGKLIQTSKHVEVAAGGCAG
ncbi:thiosulfate oxidation carrier protein SoxY [Magnetofaba australis]|nr:thiosulfate oxidation carrier protein SoxY [Magnetofaba australis]